MVSYESTFYFTKNEMEMLMGIEYAKAFDILVMLTILVLLIHEHGMYLMSLTLSSEV